MQQTEFHCAISDGMPAYCQLWQPDAYTPTRAVICLIHGLGEHSSRYLHFAKFMTAKGIAVAATDLRGHGKTEGRRGDVVAYSTLLDQTERLVQTIEQRLPNLPIVLYGHSMGGNIAINYAITRPKGLRGVVVSAPYLRTTQPIPALKLWLAKAMKNVWGGWSENNGLNLEKLSRLPQVVQAYRNDPLVHPKISVRWFYGATEAAKYAFAHIAELAIPMLLMHGTDDAITSHEASAELAALNPQHITFQSWKGLYHELHNEPEQNEVMQLTAKWIADNCMAASV